MSSKIEILNYRIADLIIVLAVSKATIWRWTNKSIKAIEKASKNGEQLPENLFPVPKKLGPKITVWNAKEIHSWNDKISA